MKSIKEKAAEYRRVIKVINENESLVDTKGSKMFEEGANYVLNEIEEFQKLFATCMNAHANGYLKSVIEQLKK